MKLFCRQETLNILSDLMSLNVNVDTLQMVISDIGREKLEIVFSY